MKIGILGCGAMAETFADTLRKMEGAECYAAASRTLERAEKFAREYGFDTQNHQDRCGSICMGTGEKTIGFLIKNTEIGEGFKTSEMKGFGIYNLGITLDIMNTETHQAIGHSSVSTRFGYLNVEQVDADSKLPTDNLDSALILTTIIYAVIMIAAIIATYFYKKIKFKNDEFRRLNPSMFAKNAILAFFLVGFIVLFVTFCIMRWGFLDNTLASRRYFPSATTCATSRWPSRTRWKGAKPSSLNWIPTSMTTTAPNKGKGQKWKSESRT